MTLEPYAGYFWQGKKIRLRALKIEDAPKKWREWTDSEARLFLEDSMDLPPVSLEKYTEDLQAACEFGDTSRIIAFGIETLDEVFVGWLNLFANDQRNGVFSFGISVFREYRQQGYAAEAAQIVMRYAFFEARFQKCNSACLAINLGSIRLHEKLGFREEGRRRRAVYAHGEFYDVLLYGLLKEEFEALNDERDRG